MSLRDQYRYHRIIDAVRSAAWAIQPDKLATILDLLAFRSTGEKLSPAEIRERLSASPAHTAAASAKIGTAKAGAVAIIPLVGTIIHRMDPDAESSGSISIERFRNSFRTAMNSPDIGSILLDVDSPGGVVDGVPEMADEIRQATATKPIVAVANTLAASAAYWLGTSASEFIVTPSAEVGSIGVWTAHEDWSKFYEAKGIKVSLLSAGKHKVDGNPFEPLGEEARAHIQSRVDDYYNQFVVAVAKNRNVKASEVKEGFGQGRVVGAKEAVSLGMADKIATLDDTIRRLAGNKKAAPPAAGKDRATRDFAFI